MKSKQQLLILYVAMLVTRAGFGSVLLLFPLYLSVGSVGVGIALSAYPLAEFISAAPIGRYVDLKGRRRTLILGLLSVSLLTMAISLTKNPYAVSVIHGIMGFSGAAVTVSSLTMITDLTLVSNRGVSMGGFDFSNIMGYAAGIVFATSILHFTGSHYGLAFIATGILLLSASIATMICVRETRHISTYQQHHHPLVALDQSTRAILPVWFGLTTILGVIFVLPRSLMELGLRSSQIGLTLALGAFGLGMGSVLFGRLSDKIGRGKTLGIGVAGLIVLLFVALNAVAHTPPRIDPAQLPILGVAAFLATATVPSALAYVGDKADTDLRGSAMGIYSMMLSLGIALGNLLGGYSTYLGGLRTILEASAAVLLLSLSATVALAYRAGTLKLSKKEPSRPST
jgi:MFS family permease